MLICRYMSTNAGRIMQDLAFNRTVLIHDDDNSCPTHANLWYDKNIMLFFPSFSLRWICAC